MGICAGIWVVFNLLRSLEIFGVVGPEISETLLGLVGFIPVKPNAWSWLTSAFVHTGVIHLVVNLAMLWMYGSFLEERMGHVRYFFLFLVSVIADSLALLVLADSLNVPAIGISGFVAGILGSSIVLLRKLEMRFFSICGFWFFRFWGKVEVLNWPAAMFVPIWFLSEFTNFMWSGPVGGGISHASHLAGFFVGIGFGLYIRLVPKSKKQVEREKVVLKHQQEEDTQLAYKGFQRALKEGACEAAFAFYKRDKQGLPPLPLTIQEKIVLGSLLARDGEPFGAEQLYRAALAENLSEDENLEVSMRLARIMLKFERDFEAVKRLLRVLHRRYKGHPRFPEVDQLVEQVKETERNLFKRPRR